MENIFILRNIINKIFTIFYYYYYYVRFCLPKRSSVQCTKMVDIRVTAGIFTSESIDLCHLIVRCSAAPFGVPQAAVQPAQNMVAPGEVDMFQSAARQTLTECLLHP